jgi:hypothetical protein
MLVVVAAALALAAALATPTGALGSKPIRASQLSPPAPPTHVLIVLFDQMRPEYADRFGMTHFQMLRDGGTNFRSAYLGYMASETVISHNVIVSGQLPKHMGWVDEAYRDTGNLLGGGVNSMQITGDLSLDQFQTLVNSVGYPKLSDYLHTAFPGTKFITVGEKSYAVESATAGSGDIGVRLSSRKSDVTSPYPTGCTNLGGRWRYPVGRSVPAYLTAPDALVPTTCGRFFINSDKGNDYGTLTTFPASLYPEDGNRFVPGSDASALAGHTGGDTWVADAAMAMMENENWSGMFVTLGGIDKGGHMWSADQDTDGHDCSTGAGQTHVDCMAKNADDQLGRMLDKLTSLGLLDETLVVLTADHGATNAAAGKFYGKTTPGASDSNWYWAPDGVWDAGVFDTVTYSNPSPALLPLDATNNLQFSYQSTAIESWLYDNSLAQEQAEAAVMKTLPGVIASYYRSGDHFVLAGTNPMTKSEKKWWKKHGQEIVDTMGAANGPDVIGLLHDDTTYSVYGDHGGAAEEVQRVPMVFWSQNGEPESSDGSFRTTDILPTILQALGIPLTYPVDGRAWSLDD